MNEELNYTDSDNQKADQGSAAGLNHIYYEIESDLLAKPNALGDIILTNPQPTVVFCNQPSEADLLEVVLNKRQISCRKLIGRVPTAKVQSVAKQVLNGEVSVLIVTDISGRELDTTSFTLLVNYAIHEDPEVYIHRTQVTSSDAKLKTIINLVSPLDHGNFHYLKKVIDFEIKAMELPSSSEIQVAQFNQILKDAEACAYPEVVSKNLEELLASIKNSPNFDTLLKYFVHNTLNVVPELKVKSANSSSFSRRGDRGDRDNQQEPQQDDFKEIEARIINRNIPKIEYLRFYVGSNNSTDINEAGISSLLTEAANLPKEQISKYIDRGSYAFVDVLKENAAGLVDILDGYHLGSGEKLIFKKAASIFIKADEKLEAKPANNQSADEEE